MEVDSIFIKWYYIIVKKDKYCKKYNFVITVKEQHFVVQLSQKQSNGTFLLDKNTPLDYFISEGRIYIWEMKRLTG